VDAKPEDKLAGLMKKKLHQSQKVLEGIALNDFKLIEKSSEELMQISKATEWRVLKTVQYQLYSNQFRRVIQTLIKNAKDKNLDAAALTYVDLTLTCVNCHKHVREVRMTRLPLELPPVHDQVERSTP
jgi:hypothetical protein